MVRVITDNNFEKEVLNAQVPVLIDFYADWCGPCRMVSPIVDEIAVQNGYIFVGKVNVDENPNITTKYDIVSIPTLIIFKDGEEASRIVGYTSKEEILKEILK